jgi:hypothetical protein
VRRLSPTSLMVLRLLLVGDAVVLAVVGLLCVLYVERPAGFVFAGGAWLLSGALFGAIHFTQPHRHERW